MKDNNLYTNGLRPIKLHQVKSNIWRRSKSVIPQFKLLGLMVLLSLGFGKLNAQSTNVGAVYAMSNGEGQVDGNVQGPNSVVAYAQAEDGTLTYIDSYLTGGNGGDFDGGEGLDPLISAYAITKTNDNRFVMAVNAGSNTVTSMTVNADFSLTVADTQSTLDVGPNSIAYVPSSIEGVNGLVYVTNITREEFLTQGEPAQQGSITGYYLMDDGSLVAIENSRRELENRPSAVQISPDGDFVVVASINSGSSALASDNQDEIVVYTLNANGTLSDAPTAGATSTLRDNAEGRNLPSAIGFQIVGDNYVVVTEAREFRPNGLPPIFPGLQDGSVSTWQIGTDGSLSAIDLDVASGENNTGRTACWLDFSDENTFFVSNAIEAGIASYSFNNGDIELLNQVAAQGTGATGNTTDPAAAFGTTEGWIDLWISDDGQYLYQAYGLTGTIGVYAIDGQELTLLQEVSGDLPANNIQGIVSVGTPPADDLVTARYRVTFDAAWSEATHPVDFPNSETSSLFPRFSPVAGFTHNSSVRLFEEGELASQGLVNISQTGSRDPLDSELANIIIEGNGGVYIESATRVRPSPDTISTTFDIYETHPLVSLTSMIAPSPDWMVAMRDLNLLENGEFVESKVVQFIPYDTGSDSGETFASANEATVPAEGITRIMDGPLSVNGEIASIGIWRFERIDENSTCNAEGGTISGGPYTFCMDGNTDYISASTINLSGNNGNSTWVITDDQGYILDMPANITEVDFESIGLGVSFVWNLAYDAGLTGLALGNNIEDLNGCFSLSNSVYVNNTLCEDPSLNAVGAVYAMTNGEGQIAGNVQGPNSVVAYAQAEDGTLTYIDSYLTGGNGGDYDGGEGLDPLISAYAITKTNDNRFVMAVNAGSNTITSMTVNDDFSLTVTDTQSTLDVGPNSIAYVPSSIEGVNGLVYVTNITREEFLTQGEPAQQGSITGFYLMDDGSLVPLENSRRELENRPSAIQISADGNFVVVASINSGSSALASDNQDEIVVYTVNADGTLSDAPTAGATSTLRDNAEGRNLPSAIGFQIVGDNYVVVTEAREFRPNGLPPIFPGLQDGSVSTWQIGTDGSLSAIDLDVASGENNTGRTACWLDFSDENTFFVSNAIEAGIASYSFNNGDIELLNQVAAQGTGATGNTTDPAAAFGTTEGWIDLWISDDGQYLYQAYGLSGTIGVYQINGEELSLLQEVTGTLPLNNIQGIVSVGGIENTSDCIDVTPEMWGEGPWIVGVDQGTFIAESANDAVLARGNGDLTVSIYDGACGGDLLGTFNDVPSGSIERAVYGNLIAGQTYSYIITGGTAIESKVKTYAESRLIDRDCNVSLTAISQIYALREADMYSNPNVQVTGFGFKFENASTGEVIVLDDVTVDGFYQQLVTIPGLEVGETYAVSVRHQVLQIANGSVQKLWSDFGPECNVAIIDDSKSTEESVNKSFDLDQVSLFDARVYPNPNDGQAVYLQLNNLSSTDHDVTIQVIDAFGRVVMSERKNYSGSAVYIELPLQSNLATGLYSVSIDVDAERVTKRLIIQ